MMPVTLTAEEEKEFTPLNCLAFDIARKEAAQKNVKIPTWLTSSEECRSRYRKEALKILNEQADPIIPFDDGPNRDVVEKFISRAVGSKFVDLWKAAELEMKRIREEDHNPQAFFC